MKLSTAQLQQLHAQGFLVLPQVFTDTEVEMLRARLPALFSDNHPGNIVEQSSGVVRTCMGLHLRDELFARLVRHPRLIGPAMQVHSEPLYIQQVKVNVKAAFTGEVWQWHYDFATHHAEDGVDKPLALNLHVFLDDVTQFNGPLYFIPGSHRYAPQPAMLDDRTTSYPLWVVDEPVVRELGSRHGLVSATGARGTVLIFFDTLLHASPGNISPWDRAIFSLIVNPVTNACRAPTRPEHKHHRDFTPLAAIADDCLSNPLAA